MSGKVSRPRAWGEKLGAGYLGQLIQQGYTEAEQCTPQEAKQRGVKIGAKLESAVDRLLSINQQRLEESPLQSRHDVRCSVP